MLLSTPAKLNVAALVVTAAGIVLQIASGSDLYPTIPPGPIILVAGAAIVALGPRRLASIVGVVVPLVLIVGGIIATVAGNEFLEQLTDPGEPGIFGGTVIQLVGVCTALAAGIVAVRSTSGHGQRR